MPRHGIEAVQLYAHAAVHAQLVREAQGSRGGRGQQSRHPVTGATREVRMSWLRESAGAVVVAALVAPATAGAQGLRPQFGVAAGVALPPAHAHRAAVGVAVIT